MSKLISLQLRVNIVKLILKKELVMSSRRIDLKKDCGLNYPNPIL